MIKSKKKNPNPMDRHIGGRIKMRRMLLRMSQETLAEHLGITFQQIQKYEKGASRVAASSLYIIARALNVQVNFFFEDAPFDESATGGFAEDASHTLLFDFLSTQDGLDLNKSYLNIPDPEIRKRLVSLARALSEKESVRE